MRRILVTGANGQVGKCIQKIADNYSQFKFFFCGSKELDITNPQSIAKAFEDHFDYCINCAAYTNVEQAEKTPEPAFEINAEGTRNLVKACLKHETILIHISTDYVFDGKKESPYTTSDTTNPINEYGKSKLKGELYIQDILKRYFIVRTSWLYSEFGNNFYKTILKKAKSGEDLEITDAQKGSPTNANNLASYIMELIAAQSDSYGIHHFTDGKAMSWYDFALDILREVGLEKEVKLDRAKNYRTFAARPAYSVLKID
jgi:dTDP-4-dehydrorhamnose reductase